MHFDSSQQKTLQWIRIFTVQSQNEIYKKTVQNLFKKLAVRPKGRRGRSHHCPPPPSEYAADGSTARHDAGLHGSRCCHGYHLYFDGGLERCGSMRHCTGAVSCWCPGRRPAESLSALHGSDVACCGSCCYFRQTLIKRDYFRSAAVTAPCSPSRIHALPWKQKASNSRRYLLTVNPLERKGNYTATSNNMQLVHSVP